MPDTGKNAVSEKKRRQAEFIENSLLKIPLGGIIHYNNVKKLTECKF